MKCPLLKITRPGLMEKEVHPQDDCLKEECAWWNSDVECCIIKSLYLEMGTIAELIAGVKEKMPLEGQFRRR